LSHNPHHDLSDEALDALLASFRAAHYTGPPVRVETSYDRRVPPVDDSVKKDVDSPG
jgi:hypothetical protein